MLPACPAHSPILPVVAFFRGGKTETEKQGLLQDQHQESRDHEIAVAVADIEHRADVRKNGIGQNLGRLTVESPGPQPGDAMLRRRALNDVIDRLVDIIRNEKTRRIQIDLDRRPAVVPRDGSRSPSG